MNVVDQLKIDEGFRSKVYKCSSGFNTIAYGFNLDLNDFPEHIASMLLDFCIEKVKADLQPFYWYSMQPQSIKDALINMCYNMGLKKLLGFKKMIAALEKRDYITAANEAMDSLWAKQVGNRAKRIEAIIRQGK